IDTFINAIFVYDDSFKIVYNGNGKEETISLEELESSTLFSQGAPYYVALIDAGNETPDATRLLGFFHAIFLK
ncbi:MAG: hypothetical protein IJW51_04790, partial [Clostridia bacterium]|nr:hypothetical protein [Clostridia bacterium]